MVCAWNNLYPGHLAVARDSLYPEHLVCTQVLHSLRHVLWRSPFLWLWEWGTELWELVSCAGIQLIPVISLPRGWNDEMLQRCLTLMECSGCTIEFRLQM